MASVIVKIVLALIVFSLITPYLLLAALFVGVFVAIRSL